MPPRHAYWTILIGAAPTAFRARDREELLPTFERLRQKQPDAVLRWFERGRIWNSPDEARRRDRERPAEPRDAGWRPGGQHRDPRACFEKKEKGKRRPPHAAGPARDDRRPAGGPPADRGGARPPRHPARDRPREPRDRRGPQGRDERPRREMRDRAPRESDRPRPTGQRPADRPRPPQGQRPPGGPRPPGPRQPWRDSRPGERPRDTRDRRPPGGDLRERRQPEGKRPRSDAPGWAPAGGRKPHAEGRGERDTRDRRPPGGDLRDRLPYGKKPPFGGSGQKRGPGERDRRPPAPEPAGPPRDDAPREERGRKDGTRLVRKVRR